MNRIDDMTLDLKAEFCRQMEMCELRESETQMIPDSAFTTIVHRDFWVNNMMIAKGNHLQ